MKEEDPQYKEMTERLHETTQAAVETASALRIYYLAYRKVGFGRIFSLLLVLIYEYALVTVRTTRPIVIMDPLRVPDKPFVN